MTDTVNQAERPHGLFGRLFGRVMGWLNADAERLAIDQLALRGDERVLEIGFGSGVGIRYLARLLSPTHVAGVEPSDAMLHQAAGRLSASQRKEVQLRAGSAGHIPWPDQTFDAVVSVNNVQFWTLPDDLSEVRRVLRPGGLVSVATHAWAVRKPLAAETDQEALSRLQKCFEGVGFLPQSAHVRPLRSGAELFLLMRSGVERDSPVTPQ